MFQTTNQHSVVLLATVTPLHYGKISLGIQLRPLTSRREVVVIETNDWWLRTVEDYHLTNVTHHHLDIT